MNTISENELKELIAELIQDRDEIAALNPDLNQRDALLWMLLGTLVSLLSVPVSEQAAIYDPTARDPYYEAVMRVLEHRRGQFYDAAACLQQVQ